MNFMNRNSKGKVSKLDSGQLSALRHDEVREAIPK